MEIEDIGITEGIKSTAKGIALIDADTIAYATASTSEWADELLPKEFYQYEEWKEIVNDPNYDEENHCIWVINLEEAIATAVDRIEEIKTATETTDVEIYFTEGRNFRYDLYDMYKGNRLGTRPPVGLSEIKHALLKKYPGEICEEYEADDLVVMLKRTNPDKYILCAVDKDVLNSVKGKHFNYYRSEKYNIPMKWQTTSMVKATQFPYKQCMMGDNGDNIPGCPGIGPKRAETIIADLIEPKEMWDAVVKTFKSKKLTIKDAIRDMRLVNMHQLTPDRKVNLWNPPV